MSIEAMKQALEALEKNYVLINGTERFLGLDQIKDTYYAGCFDVDGVNEQTNDAITALRTAIEQAEKQEPVLWRVRRFGSPHWMVWDRNPSEVSDGDQFDVMPLYGEPLL